jgi:hypothetical protein
MLNKITIVTGLMTVIALSQGSIARADGSPSPRGRRAETP